ncbi:TonB-dependent receptor [SAR92 clade bacterium H231]|nr:TonB-dependent receptor [SAR92 clade bacterium H231]
MHLLSLIFVTQQKLTADSVCRVTSRDGISSYQSRTTQWLQRLLVTALISLALPGHANDRLAPQPQSAASQTVTFNIPRQTADDALLVFGQQANVTVIYPFNRVKDHKTNTLQGVYSVPRAVAVLLANTGLEGNFSAEGHLLITQVDQTKGKSMNTSKRKNVLATMVGLFATAGGVGSALAQGDEAATAQGRIDEIIVTANKREQSLQDTAMSISALSDDTIDKRNLVGMDDYLRGMPGVTFQDRGASQNSVVIRGMTADPQIEDSTAGVYFGETPLTGLSAASAGETGGSADIKLVDIQRIEVLRGPQGTLYGASAMAGTVRVIPHAPNLQEVEGKVATSFSSTGQQGGSNTMIQGILNVPLIEDKLAIRAVAYRFDNSGFIDNVGASQPDNLIAATVPNGGFVQDRNDVGGDEYTGFRLTALWKPTDEFKATLMYLQQDIEQDGYPEVDYLLAGEFEQARLQVGPDGSRYESLQSKTDITNLVLEYDFGWGSLLSSTSKVSSDPVAEQDASIFNFNTPFSTSSTRDIDVFVQELRFSSSFDGPIQLLAGIYYEDRENDWVVGDRWSGDIALGNPDEVAFGGHIEVPVEQKSVFSELNYQLTDYLTATFGIRHFEFERENLTRLSFLGFEFANDLTFGKGEDQTYKFNLSYQPTNDVLLYGQWAEGFRLGKPQVIVPPQCDPDGDGVIDGVTVPKNIAPDTSASFELGAKLGLLDNRVTFNAAIYHINWEGMPVNIPISTCGAATFTFNAGSSKSQGVELEIQARLTEQLLVNIGTSYNIAELTEDAPNLGSDGDDLPGSADFNFSMGLEYNFDVGGHASFARMDYAYVSDYSSVINPTPGQPEAGGYSQINLKSGINFEKFDIDLYVKNLTNADEFTWVETAFVPLGFARAYRLRPRTIGVNLNYHF